MTLLELVRIVIQFIAFLGNYLADFNNSVAAWQKQFADWPDLLLTKFNSWIAELETWTGNGFGTFWDNWVSPALTHARDGFRTVSDLVSFTVGPFLDISSTFFKVGIPGLIALAQGHTTGLDQVHAAFGNVRTAFLPWVAQLEGFSFTGLENAFTAHEATRDKLNSLASWANYFFLPSGLIRDVALMESLAARSPAAVSVLLGTGVTGDEAQAFAQIAQTYPDRDRAGDQAMLVSWVSAPSAAILEAEAVLAGLTSAG